jgi:hypothetical protein
VHFAISLRVASYTQKYSDSDLWCSHTATCCSRASPYRLCNRPAIQRFIAVALKDLVERKLHNIYFVEFTGIVVDEDGGTKRVRSIGCCLPFDTA